MSRRVTSRSFEPERRGNIVILTAMILPILLAFVSFAIDWGHIAAAQGQLQNAADSAALAAAARVMDDRSTLYLYTPHLASSVSMSFYDPARAEAKKFAGKNHLNGAALGLDSQADVQFYYLDSSDGSLSQADPSKFNTVRVTTRRTEALNGTLPLFFAPIFGFKNASLTAVAQATFMDQVNGIGPPPPGQKSSLLPFAVHKDHWAKVMQAIETGQTFDLDGDGKADIADARSYSSDSGKVSAGKDGLPELRMFPDASGKNGVLSPGNFGTVDIGDGSNATSDIARQILEGPNAADFAELPGGKLDFSAPFTLEGDTGISASVKAQLDQIIGEPRTIVIYDDQSGPGNNAQFNIVGFAGVRVMFTNLTGGLKGVYIQPAPVSDPGALAGPGVVNYNVAGPLHLTQ